ncbi:MAG: RNA polymerase sigma factor [Breznakibacter sp.]
MQIDQVVIPLEKHGSTIPFDVLVEKYQHKVFHTCIVMLKNREDAEDVAQEVFLEIYRSLDKFRGEASLSTWIYRIAVNRCMDMMRMKKRKKRSLFAFQPKSNDELERLQPTNSQHPHWLMEENERNMLLNQAIEQLPERQKIAFNLAKIEGMKQERVAEIMDTTVGSVESLLIRAKRNLKEMLMKELDK